jgi:hypothetical protein
MVNVGATGGSEECVHRLSNPRNDVCARDVYPEFETFQLNGLCLPSPCSGATFHRSFNVACLPAAIEVSLKMVRTVQNRVHTYSPSCGSTFSSSTKQSQGTLDA